MGAKAPIQSIWRVTNMSKFDLPKPLVVTIDEKDYVVKYKSAEVCAALDRIKEVTKVTSNFSQVDLMKVSETVCKTFLDVTLGEGVFEEIYQKTGSTFACLSLVDFVYDTILGKLNEVEHEYLDR